MKPVKKKKLGKAWVPFTSRPTERYAFRTPIPPCSVVRWAKARARSKQNMGRTFRIGYYNWQDGLDCVWLVSEDGVYEQTIDHAFLARYFEIIQISKERSLYGKGRPRLQPVSKS